MFLTFGRRCGVQITYVCSQINVMICQYFRASPMAPNNVIKVDSLTKGDQLFVSKIFTTMGWLGIVSRWANGRVNKCGWKKYRLRRSNPKWMNWLAHENEKNLTNLEPKMYLVNMLINSIIYFILDRRRILVLTLYLIGSQNSVP